VAHARGARAQFLVVAEARGPPAVHDAIRHARELELDGGGSCGRTATRRGRVICTCTSQRSRCRAPVLERKHKRPSRARRERVRCSDAGS
jgi:hypothetical protein